MFLTYLRRGARHKVMELKGRSEERCHHLPAAE